MTRTHATNRWISVAGKTVRKDDCRYHILHNGQEVTVVANEDEVWKWCFAKERSN